MTNGKRSTEVREEIVQDSSGSPDTSVNRRERTKVVRDADGERRERVVEDIGAERRAILRKVSQFIGLVAAVVESLIGLRFLLKLIAANPNSPFANFVYNFTDLFMWPFHNLVTTPTASNGMALELNALIAIVVYALLAWVVIKLIYLIFSPAKSRTVSVYQQDNI